MSTKIRVEMNSVNTILTELGVSKNGKVQDFVTHTINRRITKYMPYRSSVLATKLKIIKSPTEIEVMGPYARIMYYGKVMVDPVTGAAGFLDKDGQWKSRKGVSKVKSERDFNYDKTKHPLAGPFWDRRLIQAEGDAIIRETQDYLKRGG